MDAMHAAVMTYGGVDIIINNAGIAGGHPIEETTLKEWQRNIDILATGYFLVAREGFKGLKAQGCGGAMVFVGSKNSIAAGEGGAVSRTGDAAGLRRRRCRAGEVG